MNEFWTDEHGCLYLDDLMLESVVQYNLSASANERPMLELKIMVELAGPHRRQRLEDIAREELQLAYDEAMKAIE